MLESLFDVSLVLMQENVSLAEPFWVLRQRQLIFAPSGVVIFDQVWRYQQASNPPLLAFAVAFCRNHIVMNERLLVALSIN